MTKLDASNLLMGVLNLAAYSFGSGWWLNLAVGILCLVSVAVCTALQRA